MHIGEKIEELLDWKGMQKKVLAERVGIPPSTLSTYIKDPTFIPAITLSKIAQEFNVSILVLLDSDPVPSDSLSITMRESAMLTNYRSLSPKDADTIQAVLEHLTQTGYRQK